MNEFYIHERFKVNNVEAVRIVPLNSSQIEMRKKPWGVIVNDHCYCGHVELRTLLGNVVDSYSGMYADENCLENFSLRLPDHTLIGVHVPDMDEEINFVYVQYVHTATEVPVLIRYQTIDNTSVRLIEDEKIRWGDTDLVSYIRTRGGHGTLMENVQFPKLQGLYMEERRTENAVYISIDHRLPMEINGRDLTLSYSSYLHTTTLNLIEGVIEHCAILKDGTRQGLITIDSTDPYFKEHFEARHWLGGLDFKVSDECSDNPMIGSVISGVKSLTNSK